MRQQIQIANIISDAIASISFNNESKIVSVAFNSNPEKVYNYTVASDFFSVKRTTMLFAEMKAEGSPNVSLGRYYNALINSEVLQLQSVA